MCMTAGKTETDKLRERFAKKKDGKLKVYKCYFKRYITDGFLTCDKQPTSVPLFSAPFCSTYKKGGTIVKPGKITSSRPDTIVKWERNYSGTKKSGATINAGFHTLLTYGAALKFASTNLNYIIVELEVHKDDFVAAGSGYDKSQAVFRKITITQSEWDKHFPPEPVRASPVLDPNVTMPKLPIGNSITKVAKKKTVAKKRSR